MKLKSGKVIKDSIHIESVDNGGFIVKIGLFKFAFSNIDGVLAGISECLNNPEIFDKVAGVELKEFKPLIPRDIL